MAATHPLAMAPNFSCGFGPPVIFFPQPVLDLSFIRPKPKPLPVVWAWLWNASAGAS